MALAQRTAALFGPRMLTFDVPSARAYAAIVSKARSEGRAIGLADGLIAAIAAANGFAVATRDVRPFAASGLSVINPWIDAHTVV